MWQKLNLKNELKIMTAPYSHFYLRFMRLVPFRLKIPMLTQQYINLFLFFCLFFSLFEIIYH